MAKSANCRVLFEEESAENGKTYKSEMARISSGTLIQLSEQAGHAFLRQVIGIIINGKFEKIYFSDNHERRSIYHVYNLCDYKLLKRG